MAHNGAVVPYNQEKVDAISSAEHLLMLDENYDDPLFDWFVHDMVNDPEGSACCETSFSGFYSEENRNDENTGTSNYYQGNPDYVNPTPIPVSPVPPSPHSCICCHILREIFYVNGSEGLKLEIHGRLGIISHAIEQKYGIDMSSQVCEHQMFDFLNKSIGSVKQFLIQYCKDREREGYIMLQDPLSSFYEALCVGVDGYNIIRAAGQTNVNENVSLNRPQVEENGLRLTKSYVAAQREKAGKLKLKDLAEYFHLPISAASKEMNICTSAIKKICRKEGLTRWPHRKIKSIMRQISDKRKSLNWSDTDERERALAELRGLEQRLEDIHGETNG